MAKRFFPMIGLCAVVSGSLLAGPPGGGGHAGVGGHAVGIGRSGSSHIGNAGRPGFTGTRTSNRAPVYRRVPGIPNNTIQVPPPLSGISINAWNQQAHGFRGNGYGYGRARHIPPGYFLTPYYFPFFDYGDSTYSDIPPDAVQEAAAEQATMTENALGEQIQKLSAEVEQLRDSQRQPQSSPPPQTGPGAIPSEEAQPQAIPLTLVLHNGEQLQVQNYAVMGSNFWDFTKQPARKIPLSSIDVPASEKATEAQGGEFPQVAGSK